MAVYPASKSDRGRFGCLSYLYIGRPVRVSAGRFAGRKDSQTGLCPILSPKILLNRPGRFARRPDTRFGLAGCAVRPVNKLFTTHPFIISHAGPRCWFIIYPLIIYRLVIYDVSASRFSHLCWLNYLYLKMSDFCKIELRK